MAEFTYIVHSRCWYADTVPHRDKTLENVTITKPAEGGGVHWEFGIRLRILSPNSEYPTRAWLVDVYDDAWAAFRELPPFFSRLSDMKKPTLKKLEGILRECGIVDDTPTVNPNPPVLPVKCPTCGHLPT